MKNTKFIAFKKICLSIFTVSLLLTPLSSSAITFGQEVSGGSSSYSFIVSVWYSQAPGEEPEFICTGTLIEQRIVLTAAHCIYSKGLYYVHYGSDQLQENSEVIDVSASWRNPRYSERQAVNDVGLLLLAKPIQGARVTTLTSKSTMVKVQSNKSVKYEIAGWGDDQNGEAATYLKKAAVDDQTAVAKKIKAWAPWRSDVWFAVGKYNSRERVFAGACTGDSGGPLFAILGGQKYLVGLASWGAENCELGTPSIYVRLSYYVDSIRREGIPQLLINEVKQNRLMPSVIVQPTIEGKSVGGNLVTCNPGKWSSNTKTVSVNWVQGFNTISSTGTLSIPSNLTNLEKYTCEVVGSNPNGDLIRELEIIVLPPPVAGNPPYIQNLPNDYNFTGSSVATCDQGTFEYSDSVINEWWIGDGTYSKPIERISTGNSLEITTKLTIKYAGKYLFCKSIATGVGGTSSSISKGLPLPRLLPPFSTAWPDVNINGVRSFNAGKVGSIATCSNWAWERVDSEKVGWYVSASPLSEQLGRHIIDGNSENKDFLVSATFIQSGTPLILTEKFLITNKDKHLSCVVMGTNAGGTTILNRSILLFHTGN